MDRGGGLTELVIDPVLKRCRQGRHRRPKYIFLNGLSAQQLVVAISNAAHIAHLDGHFVLGEGSAPQQLVDTVDGEEPCDVGT